MGDEEKQPEGEDPVDDAEARKAEVRARMAAEAAQQKKEEGFHDASQKKQAAYAAQEEGR